LEENNKRVKMTTLFLLFCLSSSYSATCRSAASHFAGYLGKAGRVVCASAGLVACEITP